MNDWNADMRDPSLSAEDIMRREGERARIRMRQDFLMNNQLNKINFLKATRVTPDPPRKSPPLFRSVKAK